MPRAFSTRHRHLLLLALGAAVLALGAGVLFRSLRVLHEAGRATTYDRVRAILVRRLGASEPDVSPGAPLGAGIDRMELRSALEEEFQVPLTDDEVAAMATVQDVVSAVDRRANR
jgi:acyl carrier protein